MNDSSYFSQCLEQRFIVGSRLASLMSFSPAPSLLPILRVHVARSSFFLNRCRSAPYRSLSMLERQWLLPPSFVPSSPSFAAAAWQTVVRLLVRCVSIRLDSVSIDFHLDTSQWHRDLRRDFERRPWCPNIRTYYLSSRHVHVEVFEQSPVRDQYSHNHPLEIVDSSHGRSPTRVVRANSTVHLGAKNTMNGQTVIDGSTEQWNMFWIVITTFTRCHCA